MRVAIILHIVLCTPANVFGISIRIQGSFDVGPKGDVEYVTSEASKLRGKDSEQTNPWKFPAVNEIKSKINKIIQGIRETLKIDHTYELVTPKNKKSGKVKNKHKSITMFSDERELKITHSKRDIDRRDKDSEADNSFDSFDLVRGEDQKESSNNRETGTRNHIMNKKAIKVKDVPAVNDFILHINKQALKTLENIKRNVSSNIAIRHKIKSFKKVYKRKFAHYQNKHGDHVIKTNLDAQKIIRNAINTSNRILQRLVNQLSETDHIDLFKKELDRQRAIEDTHACYKLGVCRSTAKFKEFLAEALQTLLLSNETELQQSFNALIEAFKFSDFSKVLDTNALDIFSDFIEEGENIRPLLIRAFYYTTLYAMIHKDATISLTNTVDRDVANRTAAFYEFMKIFDKMLSKDEKDVEWKQINQSLKDWKIGKPINILDIMKTFVAKIIKTMEKMEQPTLAKVNEAVKVLFSF